jgi:hypothetical protein
MDSLCKRQSGPICVSQEEGFLRLLICHGW